MRILVLGGTAWLGREVASTAIRSGHQVTCLARGESGDPPAGAAHVAADRDTDDAYADVQTDWDLVVDVSRQPGHVRRAVDALHNHAHAFAFVSSANVYARHDQPGADESAELLAPLDSDVMASMEQYGEAKVACENHVLAGFTADRALIARSGLIGGPGDTSGRTGYWPLRMARPSNPDGTVLVPDTPTASTEVLDVRDLAAWVVTAALDGVRGTFNTAGTPTAFGDHLGVAREVAGHTGPLVSASSEWLLEHEVSPWMGPRSLPLWLPMQEYAGFAARDASSAVAAGLTRRPLKETLADTLAWELEQGADRRRGAGLTAEDERGLLAALAAPSY